MYKRLNPIQKRNTLLIAGLVSLAIAAIKKPSLLFFFTSSKGTASAFLMILGALFGAFSFREFGYIFLKRRGDPWYARGGSFFLLALMMTVFGFVAAIIDGVILSSLGIGPIITENAYIYEFFGLVFIWIVLLEWVTCQR